MCRHVGVALRCLPEEGGRLENLATLRRVQRIRSGKLALSYPETSELDELPLVPYLLGTGGENIYDSSAIAVWLDLHHSRRGNHLVPSVTEGADVAFVARLIDEYFDEFGLYMAHHNRWVVSAASNDAGMRLAREFRFAVPWPLRRYFAERFSRRQVRRLPYLFSVAEDGLVIDGVAPEQIPPARSGFPATHGLLDRCFVRMLERLELVLSDQNYLLGSRFTVADASAYGQLAMNLGDRDARDLIERHAPLVYAWITRIAGGDTSPSRVGGDEEAVCVSERLGPLLREIGRTFVPLMEQNVAAYERLRAQGEQLFNEAAFERGQALFDGEIVGVPFRSVVKTFQVSVWRDLQRQWAACDEDTRRRLGEVLGREEI